MSSNRDLKQKAPPTKISKYRNLFLYLETGFVNERGDNIMLNETASAVAKT